MTTHTLTFLESQYDQLRAELLSDGRERGAILLCGRARQVDPWSAEVEERMLVRTIVRVPDDAYSDRTATGMTWSTTPLYKVLKLAEANDLAVVVIHSHPQGPLAFSPADDVADAETFEIVFNRLESLRPHASVVMDGNGDLVGRTFGPDCKPMPVRLIRSWGKRWRIWTSEARSAPAAEFDRQVRTFGSAATEQVGDLRIGVVGCGGTGSAVLSLLPRIAAKRVALFDSDVVDETNLNRLHFSTRTHANLRDLKVDAVGRGVSEIGLPISVVRVPHAVDDARARDAIKSCDVIFGCTDDHLGRNFLNRLAHFYLIPVIDLGVLIEPNESGGYDVFDGRVTVVQPGNVCQVCRGLIDTDEMLAEGMRRSDPELYERRRRAGYVRNAPDPSPVVVTFTTEVATMAVNELLHRITGFRGPIGSCSERVRRLDALKDLETLPAGKSRPGCKLCHTRRYDGRGDVEPFLDQA